MSASGEATPTRGAEFPSGLAGLPERLPRRYLGEGGHLASQAFRIRLSLLGRASQLEQTMLDYEDTRTTNARSYALAVLLVCAALGLWKGFVHWRESPVYLLPALSRITQTLWRSQLIIYKRSLLRSAKRSASYSSEQQPTLPSLSS